MHEYSLADQLVKTLLKKVEEDDLRQATKVHLRLGELRVISREALDQAYQVIVEDTLLEGSKLEYEEVSVTISCPQCGYQGSVDYEEDPALHFSTPILTCPECGSSVDIEKGREFEIRRLTVEAE